MVWRIWGQVIDFDATMVDNATKLSHDFIAALGGQ